MFMTLRAVTHLQVDFLTAPSLARFVSSSRAPGHDVNSVKSWPCGPLFFFNAAFTTSNRAFASSFFIQSLSTTACFNQVDDARHKRPWIHHTMP